MMNFLYSDQFPLALMMFLVGWIVGRLDRKTQDDPRRRFNHEDTNWPGPRRPYSSAAIAFRAIAEDEDAAKVRSKIIDPLAWEDPPEQFIRMDEGRVQRGNGSGGPTTPKPDIVPGFYGSGSRRTTRVFINNPAQVAECKGPCSAGPRHCDCGALWIDVPTLWIDGFRRIDPKRIDP